MCRVSTVWGVDLGVRGFHAAGLSSRGRLELFSHLGVVRGKVREQDATQRGAELVSLSTSMAGLIAPGDYVFIEEPPLAGARNLRVFLKLAQASAAVAAGAGEADAIHFVPVDTWKKGVVGRGGTSKELVAAWLERTYPRYAAQCAGNHNFVDAVALALYGRDCLRGDRSGSLGQPRHDLATG